MRPTLFLIHMNDLKRGNLFYVTKLTYSKLYGSNVH